jgi:hypothetical protein
MDFFISYTGKDVEWAEWIAWELEKEGYDCVLQAWDFSPGEDFIHQMQEAAESAKQTIAVLSPDYLASDYVMVELSAVLAKDPIGRQRSLVPVRVRPCEPAGLLRGRIYIDLVDRPEGTARTALLDGIRASLLGRRKPDDAVRFPAMPQFPGDGTQDAPDAVTAVADTASTTRAAGAEPGRNLRVLFLASKAGIPLDLEGELREIEQVIAGGKLADRIHVVSRFDVTAEDLFQSLNAEAPDVLHFSGSLNAGSILLHSADGGVRAVVESALVGLVRAINADLRLVVLNACDSLGCARALADITGCAIGVEHQITDSAAIAFSRALYRAIAFGQSVGNAYTQACLALEMDGVPREQWPELCNREGVDPRTVMLIAD